MNHRLLGILLAAFAVCSSPRAAHAGDLRRSSLDDLATTISVPLPNGTSFVVALPPHLWIQGPRNVASTTTWTCLDGDGLVLQDVIDMGSGNSHSVAFVGAIELDKPRRGESFEERLARFVQFYVPELGKKYARVDFALAAPAESVKVERAEFSVDGKVVPGWRTSKHPTSPAGMVNKPDAILEAEAAFVGDEASNACVYLVSDSKMRSLTLDQLLTGLSTRKTTEVTPAPRRVQLMDISAGLDANYPVRLAVYEAPVGFVATRTTLRLRQDLVYAEDRLDAKGAVTATWRIAHRDRVAGRAFAAEVEKVRAAVGKGVSAPKAVELGTTGAQAFLFTSPAPAGTPAGGVATAVIEFEDKVWTATWTTLGDAAAVKADLVSFETLLHGMQLATR